MTGKPKGRRGQIVVSVTAGVRSVLLQFVKSGKQNARTITRAYSAPLAAGENKPGDGGNAGVLPFHGHRGAQTVPSARWSCSSASRRTPRWATQEDKRTTRSLRSSYRLH